MKCPVFTLSNYNQSKKWAENGYGTIKNQLKITSVDSFQIKLFSSAQHTEKKRESLIHSQTTNQTTTTWLAAYCTIQRQLHSKKSATLSQIEKGRKKKRKVVMVVMRSSEESGSSVFPLVLASKRDAEHTVADDDDDDGNGDGDALTLLARVELQKKLN